MQNKNLGFDIIGFEAWLQIPNGVTMRNHVENKYGKRALIILQEVMNKL
jgi:hypothetical protein